MFAKRFRSLTITILFIALMFLFQIPPALGANIPAGSFQIDDGSDYVSQQQVTLNFSNPGDVKPITQMRIRNEGGSFSQWMPFQNPVSWQLSSGDGPKTITIEMNFLIIETRVFTANVFLDTQPPFISDIFVRPISGTAVEVNWRTSEPTFGLVRFNNNSPFTRNLHRDRTWKSDNYTFDHRVQLDKLQPNQRYNLRIEAVDRADNQSFSSDFSFSTRPVDQTPPTGAIRINGGSRFTSNPQVNLELTASDDSGPVATMSFSNDGRNWTPEEPFANSRRYVLPGGDGQRTVSVRFRDQAGNYSPVYSDTIALDSRPLQIIDIQVATVSRDTVEVRWRTDKLSVGTVIYNAEIRNYSFRENEDNNNFRGKYDTEHRVRINRLKAGMTYYAKIDAVDQTGNHTLSEEFNFSTRPVDQTPPSGSIRINGGSRFTNNPQVTLQLTASDNESGVATMSFSNDGRNWSPEEPFRSEKVYTLFGGEGQRTVFVRYRDQAGNYSQPYSDSIQLDNRPPYISNVTVNQLSPDTVEIRWRTDKPSFGMVQYNADVRNYSLRSNDNRNDFRENYGTDHVIRINRLQPGRVYYGRIDAVDQFGNHSLSPEFSFNTPVGPRPTKPPVVIPPSRPRSMNVALKANGGSIVGKYKNSEAAIDGDYNSNCTILTLAGQYNTNYYFQVSFDQKYNIRKIRLNIGTNLPFKIQYQRDGTWYDSESVDPRKKQTEFNVDFEANAIRLIWNAKQVKAVIYEVEAFN